MCRNYLDLIISTVQNVAFVYGLIQLVISSTDQILIANLTFTAMVLVIVEKIHNDNI